jgi:hypothetical protein
MRISSQEAYDKLSLYTLSKRDPAFIHQYIVDAYAAQNADQNTKPITITFALIGLYLHLEKNYSGREVQLAHMKLGKIKNPWPSFDLPKNKGAATVFDVLKAKEGEARDKMISKWSASVWEAFKESHQKIENLLKSLL